MQLHDGEVLLGPGIVRRGTSEVRLTTKELCVLDYLWRSRGRAVSHEELLEQVWGHSRLASTQPVYSTIKRLRPKIDGGEYKHLVTVHGTGYRFDGPESAEAPPSPSPALPSLLTLPTQVEWMRLSSLFGRKNELAALNRSFDEGARLVTLTGPGGIGKTRLAVEHISLAASGDIVFCDLSPARSRDDVFRLIALAVGARGDEASIDDQGAYLLHALRARNPRRVVLDNVEQVLVPVAGLVPALASIAPLLLTSRQSLGMPGERVLALPPLGAEDASALFVARARDRGAEVEGTDSTVSALVEDLDGLPLAIELAAARATTTSLVELSSASEAWNPDSVSAPSLRHPRHTTLAASVAWSWELLSEPERTLLSRLSVFEGSFTVDSAKAVAGDDESTRATIELLCSRSLLRRLTDVHADTTRYVMYRSVRDYAESRLVDPPSTLSRHRGWAIDIARGAGAFERPTPARAFTLLEPVANELFSAYRRALTVAPEDAARIALALEVVLDRAANPDAIRSLLEEAIPRAEGTTLLLLRLALGQRLSHRGRKAEACHLQTVELARDSRQLALEVEAECHVAASLCVTGESGRALQRLEELALRTEAAEVPVRTQGLLHLSLARVHVSAGDLQRADELVRPAMQMLVDSGDLGAQAKVAITSSRIARARSEFERASTTLEVARRCLEDAGDEIALAHLSLEEAVLRSHRSLDPVAPLRAAVNAHRRLGLVDGEIRARDWLVYSLLGAGCDDAAMEEARQLARLSQELGRPLFEAERSLGAACLMTGRKREAEAALERAAVIAEAGNEEALLGHLLSLRGTGRLMSGEHALAGDDYRESLGVHRRRGAEASVLDCEAGLALALELTEERSDTLETLARVEAALGHPALDTNEGRVAALRRAMVEVARARRRGGSGSVIAAASKATMTHVLGGAANPQDLSTRMNFRALERLAFQSSRSKPRRKAESAA